MAVDLRPNKLVHVKIPLNKLNARFMQTVHENNDRLVLPFHGDTRFCVYHRGEQTRNR